MDKLLQKLQFQKKLIKVNKMKKNKFYNNIGSIIMYIIVSFAIITTLTSFLIDEPKINNYNLTCDNILEQKQNCESFILYKSIASCQEKIISKLSKCYMNKSLNQKNILSDTILLHYNDTPREIYNKIKEK